MPAIPGAASQPGGQKVQACSSSKLCLQRDFCTLGNMKHTRMIGVYIWGYFRTMKLLGKRMILKKVLKQMR